MFIHTYITLLSSLLLQLYFSDTCINMLFIFLFLY